MKLRIVVVTLGGLALLFLILPILVLITRGVQTRGWEGLPDSGIDVALSLSLFTTPLALIFAQGRLPFKRVLNVLIELPIVLPGWRCC